MQRCMVYADCIAIVLGGLWYLMWDQWVDMRYSVFACRRGGPPHFAILNALALASAMSCADATKIAAHCAASDFDPSSDRSRGRINFLSIEGSPYCRADALVSLPDGWGFLRDAAMLAGLAVTLAAQLYFGLKMMRAYRAQQAASKRLAKSSPTQGPVRFPL